MLSSKPDDLISVLCKMCAKTPRGIVTPKTRWTADRLAIPITVSVLTDEWWEAASKPAVTTKLQTVDRCLHPRLSHTARFSAGRPAGSTQIETNAIGRRRPRGPLGAVCTAPPRICRDPRHSRSPETGRLVGSHRQPAQVTVSSKRVAGQLVCFGDNNFERHTHRCLQILPSCPH